MFRGHMLFFVSWLFFCFLLCRMDLFATSHEINVAFEQSDAAVVRAFHRQVLLLVGRHHFSLAKDERVFFAKAQEAALVESKLDALCVPSHKAQEQSNLAKVEKDNSDGSEHAKSSDSQDA